MRSWGHEELTEGNDITHILSWGKYKTSGKNDEEDYGKSGKNSLPKENKNHNPRTT